MGFPSSRGMSFRLSVPLGNSGRGRTRRGGKVGVEEQDITQELTEDALAYFYYDALRSTYRQVPVVLVQMHLFSSKNTY